MGSIHTRRNQAIRMVGSVFHKIRTYMYGPRPSVLQFPNIIPFSSTGILDPAKMLVSSPRYLGTFLTLFALLILVLTRRHAVEKSFEQKEIAYETSDQTVIGGGMTELQETIVYDKLSGDTPSDIEANWSATVAAKSLLQKVRDFRDSTQARYHDESRKSVRQTLEDAELELETLGKASFDTRKILQGVQKLKVALKEAEEAILGDPEPTIITSNSASGNTAATQSEESLQEAEQDRKSKEEAALLDKLQKAELDAVIAESKESPDFH